MAEQDAGAEICRRRMAKRRAAGITRSEWDSVVLYMDAMPMLLWTERQTLFEWLVTREHVDAFLAAMRLSNLQRMPPEARGALAEAIMQMVECSP